MLKALIVDDEKHTCDEVAAIIKESCPGVKLIGQCGNISEAIRIIHDKNPDIIFLDIKLGDENGFDLFKHFLKPTFKVIFITAYQQYAVEAFKFAALHYLLKPIAADKLVESIERARQATEGESFLMGIKSLAYNFENRLSKNKKLAIKTSDNIHLLNSSDILYCQSDHSYTTFFMADGNRILVSTNIGHYQELLEEHDFMRVHKSYLVNMEKVKKFSKAEGGMLILSNGTQIPVAHRKKESLMQRLSGFPS